MRSATRRPRRRVVREASRNSHRVARWRPRAPRSHRPARSATRCRVRTVRISFSTTRSPSSVTSRTSGSPAVVVFVCMLTLLQSRGTSRMIAPLLFQTTRARSAELLNVERASMLQVDPQCHAAAPPRLFFIWRSQLTPARGCAQLSRRILERLANNLAVGAARTRSQRAVPSSWRSLPNLCVAAVRSLPAFPSRPERAGERGNLVRRRGYGYFYALPELRRITVSPRFVFRFDGGPCRPRTRRSGQWPRAQ